MLKPIYKNKRTEKHKWLDEEKEFLLHESKQHTIDELSKILDKPPVVIMRMCSRIGCGYKRG